MTTESVEKEFTKSVALLRQRVTSLRVSQRVQVPNNKVSSKNYVGVYHAYPMLRYVGFG